MGQKKKRKRKLENTLKQRKWRHNIPNLWDAAEVVLMGKFIAINAYIKKEEKSQTNSLTFYHKTLRKLI